TDIWALEGRFSYLFNFNSSLRNQLEYNFGEPPSKFTEVKFFGQAGALLTPLYGKFTLFNDRQVYGEFFLSLHALVAQLDGGTPTPDEPTGKGKRMAFGGAPGFGLRGFLSRNLSVRFDFNWMILGSSGEVHAPLSLSLSLAFTTRSDI
ncbi:MAG: hypothetical protein V1754_04340, partial [Pseudomonadota bacterium]